MPYVWTILFSYLLGCSNMAVYLARLKRVDLSAGGSRNPGASNATILMGWKAGVLVAIHDGGKAALAVFLANLLFPHAPNVGAVAGVAAVMGHIYPAPMKFRGGKGFAAYVGMTFCLNWKLFLMLLAGIVVITLVTDYIVAATTATVVTVPAYLGVAEKNLWLAGILLIATAVILLRHRENYRRIFAGTEIGLRAVLNKRK